MKIKEVADAIATPLKIKINLGNNKGYENLIVPNETYKKFAFNYSLDDGITEIIKSAKVYLRKQKINV